MTTLKSKLVVLLLSPLATGILFEVAAPITKCQDFRENRAVQSSEINKRAEALVQDALSLSGTKERELVRARLRDAMRLWAQAFEADKAARAAFQVGDRYRQAMRYQDALYCYEQALEINPLDGKTRAAAFNSIAKVYSELYERGLALHYYGLANKIAQAGRDDSSRARALTGMADLYHRDGDIEKALACIKEARELRLSQERDAEAGLAYLAAEIALERGLVQRALPGFEEALAIYQRADDRVGQVKALCSLSSSYLASDQAHLALEHADRAVELAEKEASRAVDNAGALRAREMRWRAWLSRARARRAEGEKQIAADSFERAIHHLEGLYWSVYVATETSAVAFREELQAPYRELVDLLVEQGQFQAACEWAEQARARAMLGMSEARRKQGGKVDKEKSLQALSEVIAQRRAQLRSPQLKSKDRARLEREVKDLTAALDEARSKFEMQRSRQRLVWFQPATIKQLQERMAQTRDTMLEFLIGDNRSFAWLLSSSEISLEILPGRKEIEKQFAEFIETIANPPDHLQIDRDLSKVRERGERLFSTLLGQFSERIPPGKKLIIVPDGLLNYLPFEALMHNGHYLVEDHEISYVPSRSILGLLQSSNGNGGNEDKMEILAFGDPSFEAQPKTTGKMAVRTRRDNLMKQVRASRGFHLTALPRTRDEVEYIAQLFPSERRRVYIGKSATETALKGESLRRFRRLHFATHSLIDEVSPSRSAVVLSLYGDQKEDGFLEVSEISELDLDCDVVVLSACQTGRGRLLSGEGIVGLSRAFLYAGARAIVVSLWNVSDISTGRLMKSFYQNMTAGIGNAAALRETKLQVLKGGGVTRHPYYWAPFVIVGKP